MNIRKQEINTIIMVLLFLTLIGGIIRFEPIILVGTPVNDGGLFYSMTQDLVSNGFVLPHTASYNDLNIPFAYPPLAFFLAGMLSVFLKIDLHAVFQLVPALISTLTIPVFYLLASELLNSRLQSFLAVLVFSLMPSSFEWMVMGGGITRATGFMFFILTVWASLRLYRCGYSTKRMLIAGIFGSLAILSHPEAGILAIIAIGVTFLVFGRSIKGLIYFTGTGFCIVLLTSPWWATVLAVNGLEPFLAAGGTAGHRFDLLSSYLQTNLTDEVAFTFGGCLAALGLFAAFAKKEYFLPLLALSMILADPRSAQVYLMPLVGILAAIGLDEIIFPSQRTISGNVGNNYVPGLKSEINIPDGPSRWLVLFLFVYFMLSAYSVSFRQANDLALSRDNLDAFEWIRGNIKSAHKFAVITGSQPLSDSSAEWFPSLTGQVSVATVQGKEWLPGRFNDRLVSSYQLQLCSMQADDCLDNWRARTGQDFEYIYLNRYQISRRMGFNGGRILLEWSLIESGKWQPVYNKKNVIILKAVQ